MKKMLFLLMCLVVMIAVSVQSFNVDIGTSRRNLFSLSTGIVFSVFPSQITNSACLPSDTSANCIGVYKVPIDDSIARYIDTPENLRKIAPDLKWVPLPLYPTSKSEAINELKNLYGDLDMVIQLVKRGELTSAGVELLRMVPRITVDGRVVIRELQRDESLNMKAYRFETAHSDLLITLGNVDVLLGQGINGQLGSLSMAQIQCLEELDRSKELFTELLKSLPQEWNRL